MLETLVWLLVLVVVAYLFLTRIGSGLLRSLLLETWANRHFKTAYRYLEKEIEESHKKSEKEKSSKNEGFIYTDILKDLIEFKNEVDQTREKYIKLSERYKFDKKNRLQIAIDWGDYAMLVYEIQYDPEVMKLGVIEPDLDKLNENYLRRQEIIKRIDRMLSDNLSLKYK